MLLQVLLLPQQAGEQVSCCCCLLLLLRLPLSLPLCAMLPAAVAAAVLCRGAVWRSRLRAAGWQHGTKWRGAWALQGRTRKQPPHALATPPWPHLASTPAAPRLALPPPSSGRQVAQPPQQHQAQAGGRRGIHGDGGRDTQLLRLAEWRRRRRARVLAASGAACWTSGRSSTCGGAGGIWVRRARVRPGGV